MSGEQFALPEAVERLREIRRTRPDGRLIVISAADPLNLIGILTTGDRIRAIAGTRIAYRDGVALAVLEGDYLRPLADMTGGVGRGGERAGRAARAGCDERVRRSILEFNLTDGHRARRHAAFASRLEIERVRRPAAVASIGGAGQKPGIFERAEHDFTDGMIEAGDDGGVSQRQAGVRRAQEDVLQPL